MLIVAGISLVAYADEGADAGAVSEGMLAAQSSLAMQGTTTYSYTLSDQFETTNADTYNYFTFTISSRSHVYALVKTPYKYAVVAIYNSSGNTVSNENNTRQSSNSLGSLYTYRNSKNLESGTYRLYVGLTSYTDDLSVLITSEPVVSLSRPTITSLKSPSGGKATVKTSAVKDALSYQYQFSKSTSFSGAKTITKPTTTCTATSLAKGTYYYVRVRPYTVYNDGLAVYGNWSRAQAVYVKKLSNSVTISTGSKTFKYANLKKSSRSFFVTADDQRNAKLTYKIDSAPSKAKRYLSLNKSSGKFTVKKGLRKGTYTIKLKVSAAATKNYKAASKTKQITLKVV